MSLRDHDTVIKGDDRITTLDIPIGEQWDGIIADDSWFEANKNTQGRPRKGAEPSCALLHSREKACARQRLVILVGCTR